MVKLLQNSIRKSEVHADDEKNKSIKVAKVIKNTTELRSFPVLTGYYRNFRKKLAGTLAALHTGSFGNKSFELSEEKTIEFDNIMEELIPLPIPDFTNLESPFIVETDASRLATGSVSIQEKKE